MPDYSLSASLEPPLLELLVCPRDGAPLRPVGAELRCPEGHAFEVQDGVPRLTAERAGQEATHETFSAKWTSLEAEEIEQRYAQQYEWYVQRYGFGSEDGLAEFLADRRAILEAGTGTGGDAARFARLNPDAVVVGLDLSEAVMVAQRHFGGPANLHYVQGDILALPFGDESFDFISADQVIHHTPDARRAFSELARRLRPGGHLAVYVYSRKGMLRELADDAIRNRTTGMSVEECMEVSRDLTELGRELSRLGATIKLERGVPLLGIEPGEHDVQRLIYWHFLKCFWSPNFSEKLNDLVNFDWYHPLYASRHTPEEVRGWVVDAGLEVEHFDVSPSGISALARRPRA